MTSRKALGVCLLTLAAVLSLAQFPSHAEGAPAVPAFPGAEGFGAGATGGRGGRVVIVTTLDPLGPGSLNAALAPPCDGPRFVVFEVSGVIRGDVDLFCGDVTIAGQTAPGAGITIAGRVIGEYGDLVDGDFPLRNIIIRHLRVRPTPLTADASEEIRSQTDAINLSRASRVILDHVTASWASDETIDLYEAVDVTVQWSTIEESNPVPTDEGLPHNYGLIVGEGARLGQRISIHHTLFAHHQSRNPALAHGPADVVNNVMYNVRVGFVHDNAASGEFHIIGNTLVGGPSDDVLVPFYFNDEDNGVPDDVRPGYYLAQNHIIDRVAPFDAVIDGVLGTTYEEVAFELYPNLRSALLDSPADFGTAAADYQPITVEAPQEAFESVLTRAGAYPLDATTRRVVDEVRSRGGEWLPRPPADLLEGLQPGTAAADSDRDGIPDEWEIQHALDPDDPADSGQPLDGGYTALEVYVNELSDALVGAPAPVPGTTPAVGAPAGPGAPRPATPGSFSGIGSASALLAIAAFFSAIAAALSAASLYLLLRGRRAAKPPP